MSELGLTASLRQAIGEAAKTAARRGAQATTADLLEALVGERNSAAYQILEQASLLNRTLPTPADEGDGGAFSASLDQVLHRAAHLALGNPLIGTQHVLQGLILESKGVAGQWLREQGLDSKSLDWQSSADPPASVAEPLPPYAARILLTLCVGICFVSGLVGLGFAPLVALIYLPTTIRAWIEVVPWTRSANKCPRCRRECELRAMFHHQTGLCRPCERTVAGQPGHRYWQLVMLLLGLTMLSYGFQLAVAPLLANFCATLLLFAFSSLWHELGHAVVAWFCGYRLLSIHLGRGVPFACKALRGVWCYIHLPLMAGLTTALPRQWKGYRLRALAHCLAGPLANLLLAWLLWPMVRDLPEWNLARRWISVFDPLLTLFYINIAMAIVNLIPGKSWLDSQCCVQTDGGQAWGLLKSGVRDSPKFFQQMAYLLSLFYGRLHNYEAQLELLESAIRLGPGDPHLQSSKMLLLLKMGRTDTALDLARQTAEIDSDAIPEERGAIANNLAWCYYLAGEMEEADRLSAQALELMPSFANAQGTRGEVLIALGRLDEGQELVWKAARAAFCATSAAINLIALARLASLRSDREEFDRLCLLAQQLDPHEPRPNWSV